MLLVGQLIDRLFELFSRGEALIGQWPPTRDLPTETHYVIFSSGYRFLVVCPCQFESQLQRSLAVDLADHLCFARNCVKFQGWIGQSDQRLSRNDTLPRLGQHLFDPTAQHGVEHGAKSGTTRPRRGIKSWNGATDTVEIVIFDDSKRNVRSAGFSIVQAIADSTATDTTPPISIEGVTRRRATGLSIVVKTLELLTMSMTKRALCNVRPYPNRAGRDHAD